MQQRIISVVLLIGLCFGLITLVSGMSSWRLPDREQGYAPEQPIDYSHRLHAGELQMDCKFCHWAAETSRYAGIPSADVCMKCHTLVQSSFEVWRQQLRLEEDEAKSNADQTEGDSPSEPATDNTATDESDQPDLEIPSKELEKLYGFLALEDLDGKLQPIPGETPKSIPWVRVHNLPDYVYFDHRAHVTAGVTCQHCHGQVESMQRMEQFSSLSMGWCVNCHRDATKNGVQGQVVHASTDCAVCHY